jgi:hypothetical protein
MEHTIEGTPAIHDVKYIVFKRDDWSNMARDLPPESCRYLLELADELALSDATVIRGQDLLAEPLLAVYVGMLAIIIKGGNLSDEDRERLTRTADYFHDRAIQAADLGYKLPD